MFGASRMISVAVGICSGAYISSAGAGSQCVCVGFTGLGAGIHNQVHLVHIHV